MYFEKNQQNYKHLNCLFSFQWFVVLFHLKKINLLLIPYSILVHVSSSDRLEMIGIHVERCLFRRSVDKKKWYVFLYNWLILINVRTVNRAVILTETVTSIGVNGRYSPGCFIVSNKGGVGKWLTLYSSLLKEDATRPSLLRPSDVFVVFTYSRALEETTHL